MFGVIPKSRRKWICSRLFLVPDSVALLLRLWNSHHVLLCRAESFSLGSSYLPIPVGWNPADHEVLSLWPQHVPLQHKMQSSFLYIICVMFLRFWINDPLRLWRTVSFARARDNPDDEDDEIWLKRKKGWEKIYWWKETMNRFLSHTRYFHSVVIKMISVLSSAERIKFPESNKFGKNWETWKDL